MTKPFGTYRDQTFESYRQLVSKIPFLNEEDESRLMQDYKTTGSIRARNKVIESHLQLCVSLARRYGAYGFDAGDIVAEANVGLLKAIEVFEPKHNTRFSTYAKYWIKAQLQGYVLANWSMVKMGTTTAQRKLFNNLNKVKKIIKVMDTGNLRPEEITRIAEELSVPEHEVVTMNLRMQGGDMSLNGLYGDSQWENEGGDEAEWQDVLEDDSVDTEGDYADHQQMTMGREMLLKACKVLNERERDIFIKRRIDDPKVTLDVLAEAYGISRERVRQIDATSFDKVRRSILAQYNKPEESENESV